MKVLINHIGQHSIWSDKVDIPSGWQKVFDSTDEDKCRQYIQDNWKNIKPGFLDEK